MRSIGVARDKQKATLNKVGVGSKLVKAKQTKAHEP
jgi:hypothetical protein